MSNTPQDTLKESLEVPRVPGATRSDYRQLLLSGTALLDVRAPLEFAKGAFPGSINEPLMSDEERHLIGIRYKEAGQQKAIELGAELLNTEIRLRRVANWKQFAERNPDGVLYCFRGGLRSRITQLWLKQAGVDVALVEGGYKALRSFLIQTLETLCNNLNFMLIGGRTGNGKTLLIQQMGQSVDLEFLANHRGSSFGAMPSQQPSNIDFENAVCVELMKLDEAGVQRVFLEDEARMIGRTCLPELLRNTMQESPIVILECGMPERIRHCFEDYVPGLLSRYVEKLGETAGFEAYRDHHRNSLSKIQKRFGGVNYKRALELLEAAFQQHEKHNDTSGYDDFIETLLRDYYDPMYDYQLSNKQHRVRFKGTASEVLSWAEP